MSSQTGLTKQIILLLTGGILLLVGCSGVKSRFDCDATTSDTCMTMTEANQLARERTAQQSGTRAAGALSSQVNLPLTPVPAVPSASRTVTSAPQPIGTITTGSASASAGINTGLLNSTLTLHPVTSAVNLAPSCQSVRCDNPGSVHPQRSQDRIATVWIAPWVDSDNAFHQPGRVSFVVSPAEWVLPSRIN